MIRRVIAMTMFGAAGLALIAWAWLADVRWFEHHVYETYCTTDVFSHPRERVARILAAVIGFLLVCVVAPRAGRWAFRRTSRQIVGSALTIVLPVMVALVVTEWVLHRASRTQASPVVGPFMPPMYIDARGWFANQPSSSKEVVIHGIPVRYVFDARGNRVADAHTVLDRSAPTILITGESIALGYDLPYEQTCAALLAKALGVQVYNVAVTGAAADQALQHLDDALAWFEHPIATVTFVVPLALPRTVRKSSLRSGLSSSGELVPVSPASHFIASTLVWKLLERVVPLHTSEAVPLTRAILQKTVAVSRAKGARPVFLMTNYGARCLPASNGPPPLARELFDGVAGAHAIVDITSDEVTAKDALHPNEAGERKLEAALEGLLREGKASGR